MTWQNIYGFKNQNDSNIINMNQLNLQESLKSSKIKTATKSKLKFKNSKTIWRLRTNIQEALWSDLVPVQSFNSNLANIWKISFKNKSQSLFDLKFV